MQFFQFRKWANVIVIEPSKVINSSPKKISSIITIALKFQQVQEEKLAFVFFIATFINLLEQLPTTLTDVRIHYLIDLRKIEV